MKFFSTLWKDDSGQDLVEYALIAGLVSIIAVTAITASGKSINTVWGAVQTALQGAGGGGGGFA